MIGVDVTSIARIAEAIKSEAFVSRVFTEAERAYCLARPCPADSFAGLFCAKEAAAKALGTGFGKGIMPADIEITHDESGAPKIVFYRSAATEIGKRTAHLSVSHDGGIAVAVVILT